jgi:hypothetical protein
MRVVRMFRLVPFLLIIFSLQLAAQDFSGLKEIARVKKDVRTRRISSFDRTGGNSDRLGVAAGETREIFSAKGAGTITHIWVTIDHKDPLSRRNIILRMYWDGESEPSVQAPIGDFFGQGWGEFYNYSTPFLASGPGQGRALVCFFPMPFASGARITIQNDSDQPIASFYYYVDYEEYDRLPEDTGRFHAWWNHEITRAPKEGENEWDTLGEQGKNTTGEGNYLFMETTGSGQYVGVNYFVNCPTPMWYGEGDDMFFIDGEKWPPSLHGTGTEDYFNMSWCPKERFEQPYYGLVRLNGQTGWLGRTHCYRFHIQDPVRFTKSLRATIEHGHNNCLTLELASTAYWYQTEPHKPFPAVQSRDLRKPMPEISEVDIHLWRDAWRSKMGSGPTLWGNEQK